MCIRDSHNRSNKGLYMACRQEDGKIKNIKQIEFYILHAANGGGGGHGDVHLKMEENSHQ